MYMYMYNYVTMLTCKCISLMPLPLLLNYSVQKCTLYAFTCFIVHISAIMVRLCTLAHHYIPP